MIRWLEITADYRCNNRCLGCYSVVDDGPEMPAAEVLDNLREGRRQGARFLWLGGGEPTLRRDLFATVRAARRLGYTRVKLQTNGMMLSYPEFARRSVEAGVTEVNFAIKGARAKTHDRLTRTPGCYELLCQGINEMRRHGLPIEADVLVYRSNADEIPEVVRTFTPLGFRRFNLWLFSSADSADRELGPEVPRITEVMPFIVEAMDLGVCADGDFIRSLHTPPCTVPATHQGCVFRAADLDLLVANPGGYRFRVEESEIDGGLFLDRCSPCGLRDRCSGLRSSYVTVHGDEEFQPLA